METKSIVRLLTLLEIGERTALVRVYPPAQGGAGGITTWYADLEVEEGRLLRCVLCSSAGRLRMAGKQALEWLERIGPLSYELLPGSAPPLLPPPPEDGWAPPQVATTPREPFGPAPPEDGWRPARTPWGEQWLLQKQGHQQQQRSLRRVLSLIDGRRTVADLSRILMADLEVLKTLIRILQEQGLIH